MLSMRIALGGAAFAAIVASATAVRAENAAVGVWIDHTGRGAVEISDCNGKLCGHVAWVKDEENKDQCGKQIIGNVKSVGTNKWDNGWIYDPDRDAKYDVAISTIGTDKLKVMGYAGTKWLSETYTWKRAPADLQKCGTSAAQGPAPEAKDAANVEPKESEAAKSVPEPAPTNAPKANTKADTAKSDSAPAETTEPDTAKIEATPSEAPKADAATDEPKSDEAKAEEPTSDEPKKATTKKDTAKKDAKEDTAEADDKSTEDAGKIVSRIIESLDEGEDEGGSGAPKKKKGTCKFNVPYADIVVPVPCDK